MFCTNCGTQFDGNFCPNCGTPAFSEIYYEKEPIAPSYPEPPIGQYKASPCMLIIENDHLVIVGKRVHFKLYDLYIPYSAIRNVYFSKAPLGGQMRITWDQSAVNFDDIQLQSNFHVFEFTPARFKEFSEVSDFLKNVAYINSPSEASMSLRETILRSSDVNVVQSQNIEKPLSKRERIRENRKNAIACCPKCGSTSLSANKKGFGIGKAVIGAAFTGPIGLTAGNIGSKKVIITCLNCGHQWKP